jgi:2-polyprenyl-3-methyl-5-hydroxy-6-metoxy-1,4-benzoquinol methylase
MDLTRFEEVSCDLCGSAKHRVLIRPTVTEFDPGKVISAAGGIMGTQQVVQCASCGLAYVTPRVVSETVVSSYKAAEDTTYVEGGAGRATTFAQCARMIERWRRPPGRLLDVGCASGFFVQAARARGWDAEGIEPCHWLVAWGKEHLHVPLRAGTLAEAGYEDGTFDVVSMWDVLEHVPSPRAQLQECARVLKPGGMLVINYPDFGCPLARLAGRRWWFLLSNHLYYFTRATMRRYLEATGFVVKGFSMHWQTLPLGHLAGIFRIYNPGLAKVGVKVLETLRLAQVPMPYYASQTNVVAVKICGDKA